MKIRASTKRAFRPMALATQKPRYPDLASAGRGHWVKVIAGALSGAALVLFMVSCTSNPGLVVVDSAPLDLTRDIGSDLDGGTDIPDRGVIDTADVEAYDLQQEQAPPK
jgi:hypothetical protein